ncbi:hypothetical protein [uncultured Clostridium sp.]|uniref:hypothetical protein n=1 Tax=uncultured Clostridium sp. TaxID=59620 RepID=UPI0025D1F532|nr:hypothetical protein [uncultured Clostridium sp.]
MESKSIKITNLFLDIENYRFEKQNSQLEAIVKMINAAKEKLFNLAEDILNVGLNPTDKPLVIKGAEENQYIVLEGNRRLTSLKLLYNPDLIPDEFANLRKKFIRLRAERQKNIPSYIDCEVCADRREADIWIKRKHAQGLNGIGVEQWNSQQRQRFDERTVGKTSDVIQVLTLLNDSEYVDQQIKHQLPDLRSSNLQRLLADPYVRTSLGIIKKDGKLYSVIDRKTTISGLVDLVKSLMNPNLVVSDIYNKANRKTFIDKLFAQQGTPQNRGQKETAWIFLKKTNNDNIEKNSKSLPDVVENKNERKSVVPRKLKLPITNKRIACVFEELSKLSLKTYTNTIAVMVRIFLELSVDYYLELFGLIKEGKLTACSSGMDLNTKVSTVVNHMYNTKKMTKDLSKGIRTEIKDPNSTLSVESLNAYVHNFRFTPKPQNLAISWDNIQPFFEILWKSIEAKEKEI